MQARERTLLIGQMLSNTSYGPATVWRCAVGLAFVIVVTLQGTYPPSVRDASLTAAETKQLAALDNARAAAHRKELLDDARAAAHRKVLFDTRRLRFEQVAPDTAGRSASA